MLIRPADQVALADVLRIHELAFGRPDETRLVRDLLADPTAQPVLSLLAEIAGQLVGHIFFSAIHPAGSGETERWSLLAPLAVLPDFQGRGIGGALIEAGCGQLATRGTGLVFVLGDPAYYGRHGFRPALPEGLEPPYPVDPPEAWMVRPLRGDLPETPKGKVRCADALAAEMYWKE